MTDETQEKIEYLGMQNRGHGELFAGGGRSGEDKNAGADNGADAESSQAPGPKRFFETMRGVVRVEISLSMDLQQRS